jgi:hypothetical protein
MKQLLSVLFLTAGLASAVHLDFGLGVGVKGGFPVTDVLTATGLIGAPPPSVSTRNNYLVGPVAELRLPFGFAIEGNGLYRGSEAFLLNAGGVQTQVKSSSWEIPYLAKWRFPIPLLKPFISAGGAYRVFNDLPSDVTPSHNAFVGGAGLELRLGRLRISGEARYLHWGEPPSNAAIRLSRNQGEVLFGLIF